MNQSVQSLQECQFHIQKHTTRQKYVKNFIRTLPRAVLMATTTTGLVNGQRQITTPCGRIHIPSTNRQEICHSRWCQWPLHLCQIWCKSAHGKLLHKWVKGIKLFFIYTPFIGNSPTGRPVERLSCLMPRTMQTHKDVPVGVLLILILI